MAEEFSFLPFSPKSLPIFRHALLGQTLFRESREDDFFLLSTEDSLDDVFESPMLPSMSSMPPSRVIPNPLNERTSESSHKSLASTHTRNPIFSHSVNSPPAILPESVESVVNAELEVNEFDRRVVQIVPPNYSAFVTVATLVDQKMATSGMARIPNETTSYGCLDYELDNFIHN